MARVLFGFGVLLGSSEALQLGGVTASTLQSSVTASSPAMIHSAPTSAVLNHISVEALSSHAMEDAFVIAGACGAREHPWEEIESELMTAWSMDEESSDYENYLDLHEEYMR